MKKIILIMAMAILLLTSCQITKKTASHSFEQVQTSNTKIKSDTASRTSISETKSIEYINVPDSASITALIKCNEKGQAFIQEITELKAGLSVKPKMKMVDNYIYLECKIDSFRVYEIIKNRLDTVQAQSFAKSDSARSLKKQEEMASETDLKVGFRLSNMIIPGIMVAFVIVVIRWARKNKYI